MYYITDLFCLLNAARNRPVQTGKTANLFAKQLNMI